MDTASNGAKQLLKEEMAEELLQWDEEKYRTLVEEGFDGIFIQKGPKIIFANKRLHELLGYERGELQGIDPWLLYHPDFQNLVVESVKACPHGGTILSHLEVKLHRKDGSYYDAEINARSIDLNGVSGIQVWVRDIAERKRVEEEKQNLEVQIYQEQKMQAIGTLAGGIAHCFNNLLMGIQGNASLVLLGIDPTHPHYEKLKHIEQQVQSGADLTKQLLGFARGGKYEVRRTNLNDLIEESSRIFGRTKQEIQIHKKFEKDIWPAEVDQGQIEQVLFNLYVNAWQAVPGGGDLYIESENVTLGESYVKPYDLEPGRFVKISVRDNGIGIDETTQQRIFEPFFTTKEMGRAKGLGLAAAYGIIKNHSGIINVSSKKGEGTTFDIFLPVPKGEVLREKESPGQGLKERETILFVDGEDMIADVGSRMLKKLGYEVLSARCGQEAVKLYEENKDKIHMVLLDIATPNLQETGAAYHRIREMNPAMKVLFTSGNGIDGQVAEILDHRGNGFIHKPFTLGQLSHKVREILDRY
jgi:two-component system cell cycle sensor histidine kinase/response regulator CckA